MVHNRQLAAWVCAACALSFAHTAGKLSWYLAAFIAAGMGLILLYILYLAPANGFATACVTAWGHLPGRIVLLLCAAWTALMAGFAAALTAEAFPAADGSPMIPLTVLLLSAWAVHNGVAVGARVSAVLLPFLVSFFVFIVAFGWREVELELRQAPAFDLRAVCVILLPLGASLLPRAEGKTRPLRWIAGLCIAAAALAATAAKWGSLYRAVMSISVFGVMERFEALLCAAMAAGGVCLCTLLGSAGLGLLKEKRKGAQTFFWALAVIGLALTNRQNTTVLLVCSLIFWVAIPLVTQWIAKSQKDEKRC